MESFRKLTETAKNKRIPQYIKSKIFDKNVLPVLTYGDQTCSLTKQTIFKDGTTYVRYHNKT